MVGHSWLRLGALVCTVVLGTLGVRAAGADLTAEQQSMLADATSHLDKAEASLKLAQDTAGPGSGAVPASKARLAMARLASAKSAVPQVTARLERLPGDDPAVEALRTRLVTLEGAIAALEARLTAPAAPPAGDAGKVPPAGAGQPAPAAGAGGARRLDYRQEQALKDAQFHIREVQGAADALEAVVKQVQAATDPSAVGYQTVGRAMNTVVAARQKAENARKRFEALPPDGPGVADAVASLEAAVARVDAAEATLAPLDDQLKKTVDPGSYPNAKADLDRLRELTQMYGDPTVFQSNRPAAAAAIREASAVLAEHDRILKAYAPLVAQQTELGRQFEGAGRYFTEKTAAFAQAAAAEKASLPAAIDADLAKVAEMADDAVKNERPAWFTGGIPQQVGFVEEKVDLLAALDAPAGAAAREKLREAQAQLKVREASLREAVIAANDLPPDRYAGGDKADLAARATEAWKKVQPDAEVLAVRFPGQDWKRETMWRYSNATWYKVDRSRLQAQAIVKLDDRTAAIRAINLWKDHLSGDALSATPLDDKADPPDPRFTLLLEKVR